MTLTTDDVFELQQMCRDPEYSISPVLVSPFAKGSESLDLLVSSEKVEKQEPKSTNFRHGIDLSISDPGDKNTWYQVREVKGEKKNCSYLMKLRDNRQQWDFPCFLPAFIQTMCICGDVLVVSLKDFSVQFIDTEFGISCFPAIIVDGGVSFLNSYEQKLIVCVSFKKKVIIWAIEGINKLTTVLEKGYFGDLPQIKQIRITRELEDGSISPIIFLKDHAIRWSNSTNFWVIFQAKAPAKFSDTEKYQTVADLETAFKESLLYCDGALFLDTYKKLFTFYLMNERDKAVVLFRQLLKRKGEFVEIYCDIPTSDLYEQTIQIINENDKSFLEEIKKCPEWEFSQRPRQEIQKKSWKLDRPSTEFMDEEEDNEEPFPEPEPIDIMSQFKAKLNKQKNAIMPSSDVQPQTNPVQLMSPPQVCQKLMEYKLLLTQAQQNIDKTNSDSTLDKDTKASRQQPYHNMMASIQLQISYLISKIRAWSLQDALTAFYSSSQSIQLLIRQTNVPLQQYMQLLYQQQLKAQQNFVASQATSGQTKTEQEGQQTTTDKSCITTSNSEQVPNSNVLPLSNGEKQQQEAQQAKPQVQFPYDPQTYQYQYQYFQQLPYIQQQYYIQLQQAAQNQPQSLQATTPQQTQTAQMAAQNLMHTPAPTSSALPQPITSEQAAPQPPVKKKRAYIKKSQRLLMAQNQAAQINPLSVQSQQSPYFPQQQQQTYQFLPSSQMQNIIQQPQQMNNQAYYLYQQQLMQSAAQYLAPNSQTAQYTPIISQSTIASTPTAHLPESSKEHQAETENNETNTIDDKSNEISSIDQQPEKEIHPPAINKQNLKQENQSNVQSLSSAPQIPFSTPQIPTSIPQVPSSIPHVPSSIPQISAPASTAAANYYKQLVQQYYMNQQMMNQMQLKKQENLQQPEQLQKQQQQQQLRQLQQQQLQMLQKQQQQLQQQHMLLLQQQQAKQLEQIRMQNAAQAISQKEEKNVKNVTQKPSRAKKAKKLPLPEPDNRRRPPPRRSRAMRNMSDNSSDSEVIPTPRRNTRRKSKYESEYSEEENDEYETSGNEEQTNISKQEDEDEMSESRNEQEKLEEINEEINDKEAENENQMNSVANEVQSSFDDNKSPLMIPDSHCPKVEEPSIFNMNEPSVVDLFQSDEIFNHSSQTDAQVTQEKIESEQEEEPANQDIKTNESPKKGKAKAPTKTAKNTKQTKTTRASKKKGSQTVLDGFLKKK